MKSFYNTIGIQGEILFDAIDKAFSQQELIFEFMKRNQNKEFTPFEIHAILFDEKTPITSIRRAMTNLQGEGKIKKTEKKVMEKFGKVNFKWKYE